MKNNPLILVKFSFWKTEDNGDFLVFFLGTAVLGSLGSFVSCSEDNSGSLLKRLAFTDIREYGYLVYKIRPEMKSKSEIREMLIYSVFNKRYLPPIIFINSADDIRL